MYARLINFTFEPSVTHDQAHDMYQDLVKQFQATHGCCGYSLMLMSNARHGVTLTYWDDAEAASAAGERILPMIIERMRDLLTEPPEILGYEVIDHVMIDQDRDDSPNR